MSNIAEDPTRCNRWNSQGEEWHTHTVVHAHPLVDGQPHDHILATSTDVMERLRRLLRHATHGTLTRDYQAEAAQLLAMTEMPVALAQAG